MNTPAEASSSERRRGWPARIGVLLLNLLAPGLGLLRVGGWRPALLLLVTPTALIGAVILLSVLAPTATFAGALVVFSILVAGWLLTILFSLVLTWRQSAFVRRGKPPWSRWYGLIAAWLLVTVATNLIVPVGHRFYKPFYVPAESMSPTLDQNDKILADMRGGRSPKIGEIVLVDTGTSIYVKRIAALAGDTITMRGGVPVLNGRPASQRDNGFVVGQRHDGNSKARLISERLPGEIHAHAIYDDGPSAYDDTEEYVVPAAHIFVLGDNRDNSADSRVAPELHGTGMIPVTRIVGRPLFIHWSDDRSKIGRSLVR